MKELISITTTSNLATPDGPPFPFPPRTAAAHPTADHFVPLLLTVGAADDPGSAVSAIDRMVMGNSTRSVQLT
ncbi:hypothetical protein ACLQ2R_26725 [Streptosporangium sp. DT93]|uniref:hypothetical protein n=1 Tax=Streptosporangium sp. DT93 TaxID=3393428 RepID=UPI003CFA4A7E